MTRLSVVLMLLLATTAVATDVRKFRLVDRRELAVGGGFGAPTLTPYQRTDSGDVAGPAKASPWTTGQKVALGVSVTVASLAVLAGLTYVIFGAILGASLRGLSSLGGLLKFG